MFLLYFTVCFALGLQIGGVDAERGAQGFPLAVFIHPLLVGSLFESGFNLLTAVRVRGDFCLRLVSI